MEEGEMDFSAVQGTRSSQERGQQCRRMPSSHQRRVLISLKPGKQHTPVLVLKPEARCWRRNHEGGCEPRYSSARPVRRC